MSGRKARAARRSAPCIEAGQLIQIAMALPAEAPVEVPLHVIFDQLNRSLTQRETTQVMVILALAARCFALRLPAAEMAETQAQLVEIFDNADLWRHEWDHIERRGSTS